MSHLGKMQSATFVIEPGCPLIDHHIREAIEFSSHMESEFGQDDAGPLVEFEFEGVVVAVKADSDPELIFRDWLLARNGYIIDLKVGPHPNPELSRDEQENCAHSEAAYQTRLEKIRDEHLGELAEKRRAVETKLAESPKLEVISEELWESLRSSASATPPGDEIIDFAERWGRRIQQEMNDGNELEDVAESTADEVNFDNLTPQEKDIAVMILSAVWAYGDQLQEWYISEPEWFESTVTTGVLIIG